MVTAEICTALLGLLLFGLSAAVTLQRRRSGVFFGYEMDPADRLYRLIRAHGNTAEYAPMLCILMLLVAHRATASWPSWMFGAATACRYFQAMGMLAGPTMNAPPRLLRLLGTGGTYIFGVILCGILLFSV